jgi:restriction endonuclease S subunit
MREGWVETTLGDVAEYVNGYPFKPEELGDEGLPVIRIKQLLDPNEPVDRSAISAPDRCRLTNGDIVFSWSGTLAVRKWDRGTALLNQHLFRVIEKPGVNREWLAIALDYALTELGEKSHGTTMKHITKQTLLPHKVSLPPLTEQRRIVDVIESVDNYITALETRAETARKARSALLRDLLSNPDPDWVDTEFGEVAHFVRGPFGGSLKKSIFVESGFPVYEQQHAISGDFSQVRYFVNQEKFESMQRFHLRATDLIMSCSGTVGRAAIAPADVAPGVINQALLKISANSDIDPYFLHTWMNSEWFKIEIGANKGGGVQQNVTSVAVLKKISISLPPLARQIKISEIAIAAGNFISALDAHSERLITLRSALLSDLLSGNHEIPASFDQLLGVA